MKRLLLSTAILMVNACGFVEVDETEVPTSISIMIMAAAVPDPGCVVGPNSKRLKRGLFDIAAVSTGNPTGTEYNSNLIIRDQTETGVGSKRLEVSYDFSSNLVQPSTPTRNSLRREITVPFGGWTEAAQGSSELVATAPIIPEHVTDLLANDPNIAGVLHRGEEVLNTVSGLPGYYTVQIKLQALSLGKNGQWLRSPPYYMTVDLCDGCLLRRPAQLAPAEPTATCRRNQDEIWQVLTYPPFPDLTATTEGAENPGAPSMLIEVANGGGRPTLGSLGARRAGASRAGVWLAMPRYLGQDDLKFKGLAVPRRTPYAACDVTAIEDGESETCAVATYPSTCADGSGGCSPDVPCANGSECVPNSALPMVEGPVDEPIIKPVHCGSPSENQGGGGDGGPDPEAGPPVVACLYIVCADIDNDVLEWSVEAESWEAVASNCSCYSEDSELAENACPF